MSCVFGVGGGLESTATDRSTQLCETIGWSESRRFHSARRAAFSAFVRELIGHCRRLLISLELKPFEADCWTDDSVSSNVSTGLDFNVRFVTTIVLPAFLRLFVGTMCGKQRENPGIPQSAKSVGGLSHRATQSAPARIGFRKGDSADGFNAPTVFRNLD
jgi:hypothetical protein